MSTRVRHRRGFALPMVVLLAMVGAIMAAVMLERQAAQQLSVQRQLARYDVHHTGRGVEEAVGTWLNTVQSEPVENLVGKDGHALDIELKDGRIVSIFLTDAQGTVLGDLSGVEGAKAGAAAGIIDRLRAAVGAENLPALLRAAGPLAVNANTASQEVLTAVAEVVLKESAAASFAESIIRERKDGKPPPGKLNEALTEAGATPEERTALLKWVTEKPTLYRLKAEVRGPDRQQTGQVLIIGATKLLDRYSGLVVLEPKTGGGRGAGTNSQDLLQPLRPFLTWEHVPPEKPGEGE